MYASVQEEMAKFCYYIYNACGTLQAFHVSRVMKTLYNRHVICVQAFSWKVQYIMNSW